jgi:adenosylcobinamide-GDP ribazoletransferase
LRVGPTLAVGAVTLALCFSISLIYVGWQPGATLSLTGYVAMAVGLLAAWVVARRAVRRLGGVTGDVLGALVETATAATLLACTVLAT